MAVEVIESVIDLVIKKKDDLAGLEKRLKEDAAYRSKLVSMDGVYY